MRRGVCLLVAVLGIGGCGEPDTPFHPEDLSVEHDFAVRDFAMPDLQTPDLYRRSWVQQPVPVTTSLYAIGGAAGEVYAVGDQGVILHTTDDGASWTRQASGTNAALFGVWTDGTVALAVGYHGTLLRSIDHGATWQTTIFGSATLLAVAGSSIADDGGATTQLFAVGEAGTILQSTDGGQTWIGTSVGAASNSLNGVWASAVESFTVGKSGLFRTRDGGLTWTELAFEPGNEVWATGSGQILVNSGSEVERSRDGGLTWSTVTSPAPIVGFAAFLDGELWVVRSSRLIDHYVDDFDVLIAEDTAQAPAPINAIWGRDPKAPFIVGDSGFVAHWQ